MLAPSRSASATWAGSRAAIASAARGISLPNSGPERAVVGLDLVAAQLVGGRDEADAPDVELLADHVDQALDRLALAVVGDDDGLGRAAGGP